MKKIVLVFIVLLSVQLTIAQKVIKHPAHVVNNSAGVWKVLGSRSVTHNADHDKLDVPGPHDAYRKLKLKVTQSPLNMQKMVVDYDSGAPQNIELRQNIEKGGESRVIDLHGGKRKIRAIHFWYDTKGFLNGKAVVTVFGMK